MDEKVQRQDSEPFRMGPIGPYEPDPDIEQELSPIVIDLGKHRAGNLDESFLRMFGGAVKMLLRRMFGDSGTPILIRGTQSEIKSFSKTLSREKKYLEAMEEFGLDDPKTHRNKAHLDKAVAGFERKTGIRWPFK